MERGHLARIRSPWTCHTSFILSLSKDTCRTSFILTLSKDACHTSFILSFSKDACRTSFALSLSKDACRAPFILSLSKDAYRTSFILSLSKDALTSPTLCTMSPSMMTPHGRSHLTPDADLIAALDLIKMPDDGYRHELVRGELIQVPFLGQRRGRIVAKVTTHLWNHVEAERLGQALARTGYLLESNPDTVRAPDASFISRERLDEIGETDGYWPGAPDLVVEVISPNDRYTDVEAKVSEWLEAGTRMGLGDIGRALRQPSWEGEPC